jgi:cell wall-associated NlpC family hydrolase
MTWYFDNPQRQAALLAELESWRGTRFWEQTSGRARKGVCADCVSFCERVYVALGAMEPIRWPRYVTHHGGAAMLTLVLESVAKIPRLAVIWTPETGIELANVLMPGDLVVASSGRALHHMAIYSGGNTLWHCVAGEGVCQGNIHDPIIRKHTRAVYRFQGLEEP